MYILEEQYNTGSAFAILLLDTDSKFLVCRKKFPVPDVYRLQKEDSTGLIISIEPLLAMSCRKVVVL